MTNKKIVIIGGGISGLATAYSLEERAEKEGKSVSITLLEKKNQIGGNILTEREDGFLIEGGPDCFLSEKPWAIKLAEKLGISDKLLCTNDEFRKTFVLYKGVLRELPEGVILMIPTRIMPLVKSDLISFTGKIRMAMELFIPKKKTMRDESLSEFVRRRLGEDVLNKIAEPLVAGIHAGNPDTMSVRSTFPKFVQMEEEYGSLIKAMLAKKRMMLNPPQPPFEKGGNRGISPKWTMFMTLKDGLYELPETVVRNLKSTEILTNREVINIEKSPPSSSDTEKNTLNMPKYKIFLKSGDSIDADAVVFASPAYETGRILRGLDNSISEILDKIPYVSTATITLAYKKEETSHPMNGFGFVIPKLENRKIMAGTWISRKFSYRAPDGFVLIRCFVGGSHNEGLVSLNDSEMKKVVGDELRDIMGITAEPVITRIYRWEKAMPQYTIGHDERLSILEKRLSNHSGILVTGSAYRGIGISGCIYDADVTAESIIKYLFR